MATRVYVGRLPYRATERDIKRFFRSYGKISDVILKNGFAFVDFDDGRDAEDAVHDLNGKELMGVSLIVDIARGTPHGRDRYGWQPPPSGHRESSSSSRRYRLIVENLSSRVTSQDLKDLFRKYCDVVSAEANGKHKNEGWVEFASSREVDRALDKLDGVELEGRKIRLVEEKRRKSRSRSGSHSKRRRHSRSRTRSGENHVKVDAEPNGNNRGGRSRSRSASRGRRSDDGRP